MKRESVAKFAKVCCWSIYDCWVEMLVLSSLIEIDELLLFFFYLADFCSRGGHNCHPEATCRNGLYNYTCHCHEGFTGNGFHCEGKKCCIMHIEDY